MQYVYLVLSNTGSAIGKIIRSVTGDRYAHSAISLHRDLDTMYSFGRVFAHNPVFGGFVKESPRYGTLKRFHKAEIALYRLPCTDTAYEALSSCLHTMYAERRKYRYNYIGLFLAKSGRNLPRRNHYYCSEFVREILVRFSVVNGGAVKKVVRPAELAELEGAAEIYRGQLSFYRGDLAEIPAVYRRKFDRLLRRRPPLPERIRIALRRCFLTVWAEIERGLLAG